MPMNRIFLLLLALSVLFASCSDEEDTLPKQRENIVNYLKSTHTPRLIPYEQTEQDGTLPYYTTSGSTAYRYISNITDPNRSDKVVTASSRVTITFRLYVFSFTNISDTVLPLYTNDESLRDAFIKEGLNAEYWDFKPWTINMNRDHILKGLYHALIGCHQGDQVEAYMTYNMAYDQENFGTIPRESPVALFFTVNQVE